VYRCAGTFAFAPINAEYSKSRKSGLVDRLAGWNVISKVAVLTQAALVVAAAPREILVASKVA
jgi:hypothetical protein